MRTPDIIASIGVTILLVAFFLNLYGKLSSQNKAYSAMNLLGAAICAVSSYMIRFYPFIVLESIWAPVALVSLFKVPHGTRTNKG